MNSNFIDFIEIGTSDFETEIQLKNNKTGLSIEPIQYYLNKLPEKKNCLKLNLAISDKNSETNVFFLKPEIIKKYNLPECLRGCNSIGSHHPTVNRILKENNINIEENITSYKVKTKTLYNVIIENNINGFFYLKIDTEGHDTYILKQFFNDVSNNNYLLPHEIKFESNILTNKNNLHDIINCYISIGYDLIYSKNDTLMKLNLKKIKNKKNFIYIENYTIINNNKYKNIYFDNIDFANKFCIENNSSGYYIKNNLYYIIDGNYLAYNEKDSIILYI
mgnify:CR=1 FL=1